MLLLQLPGQFDEDPRDAKIFRFLHEKSVPVLRHALSDAGRRIHMGVEPSPDGLHIFRFQMKLQDIIDFV